MECKGRWLIAGKQLTRFRFLLARLHIESLATKNTIKAVREALKGLPNSLRDSYDVAMQRIESQNDEDRQTARSAIVWVANAKRPLTVSELQTALAIEPYARRVDKENVLDIEIILAVCAGLVIVDEKLSVVRLVHHTTQEYLDSIQAERFPDAQTEITRTLLTFLAFDGFPDSCRTVWELPPLIEYSQYCLVHAVGKPESQVRNMLVEFLGRAFRWKQAMQLFNATVMGSRSVDFPRLAITTLCFVGCCISKPCGNCKIPAGDTNEQGPNRLGHQRSIILRALRNGPVASRKRCQCEHTHCTTWATVDGSI
jgi:hypothetical protein